MSDDRDPNSIYSVHSPGESPSVPPLPDPSETKPFTPSSDLSAQTSGSPPVVPPLPPGSASPEPPQLPPPSVSTSKPAPGQSPGKTENAKKGAAGGLAAIGLAIAKFWGVIVAFLLKFKFLFAAFKLLTFGKILLTSGSLLFSILLYSFAFGWQFAVGFVLMIFVHECGHAFAAMKKGKPISAMIFVPFMGAYVTHKQTDNVTDSAFIAIFGPVAGGVFGLGALYLAYVFQSPFWLALAHISFLINLFNLAPAPILDGGRIASLFSPKLLVPGMAICLAIYWRNPIVWVMMLLSIPNVIYAWKHAHEMEYYRTTSQARWIYGLSYLGLALALGYLSTSTLTSLRQQRDSSIRLKKASLNFSIKTTHNTSHVDLNRRF